MSKPEAPTPPDPQETAAAQTGTNVATSIANTAMGQVNQVGPDGSLTYEQTGTYNWRDPNSGAVYQLPQYTATTTLSEDAQQLRDLNNESSIALGTLGRDAANRAGSILGEDFNIDGVTPRADRTGMGPVEYGSGPTAPELMADSRSLPNFTAYTADGGYQQNNIADPAIAGVGAAPELATVGANGMPQFGELDGSAGLATGYQNDFSAERADIESQLMGQLNEQRGKDMEALRSRLYNQGVVEGSEQYSRAMEDFDRSFDDRRLAAMRESLGFTERMTAMSRDEAAFGNTALQTELGNRNDATIYGDQRASEALGQEMAVTGFNNDTAGQQLQQQLASAGFNNDVLMQKYGVTADQLQYNNELKARVLADVNAATSGNNANAQTLFGMGSDQLAYNNNIAQQTFGNEGIVTDRANANANANFNEERILADDRDRVRAQEIDEAAWLRNQPINEIAALMSGSQVQTPNFAMAQPYAMPTTDIAGITQQGFGNEMANYQAQNSNWQAMMGGLFGLGSAAIMRPR